MSYVSTVKTRMKAVKVQILSTVKAFSRHELQLILASGSRRLWELHQSRFERHGFRFTGHHCVMFRRLLRGCSRIKCPHHLLQIFGQTDLVASNVHTVPYRSDNVHCRCVQRVSK